MSQDGSVVAFACRGTNLVANVTYVLNMHGVQDDNVFLWERGSSLLRLVSRAYYGTETAEEGAAGAVVSADGRYIVYGSRAVNLVSGITYYALGPNPNDLTIANIFRYDRINNATEVV